MEKEKMSLFLDDFWAAVASLRSKAEARNFFNQFLTHTERKMFAKRFQIAMMLLLDYDYQSMRKRLKVSDATISKINNWLEENGIELISVAKRIIKLKESKLEILESNTRKLKGKAAGLSSFADSAGEIAKIIREDKKEKSLLE